MLEDIRSSITCRNPQCLYFEKEDGKHIIKWGKNRAGHQQYLCSYCKKVFVETKNTHLYNLKISEQDVKLIYMYLMTTKSICSIAKMTGHHEDTIRNFRDALLRDPKGAERIIFYSIDVSKSDMDNIWNAVWKSKKEPINKQVKPVLFQ